MTDDQTPDEPLEHELVAEARAADADETITIQGHTLRSLSDAMNAVGNGLVAELEPWVRGGREGAIATAATIPVLVMDVAAGDLATIVEVKHVLLDGKRYVVFGTRAA